MIMHGTTRYGHDKGASRYKTVRENREKSQHMDRYHFQMRTKPKLWN